MKKEKKSDACPSTRIQWVMRETEHILNIITVLDGDFEESAGSVRDIGPDKRERHGNMVIGNRI